IVGCRRTRDRALIVAKTRNCVDLEQVFRKRPGIFRTLREHWSHLGFHSEVSILFEAQGKNITAAPPLPAQGKHHEEVQHEEDHRSSSRSSSRSSPPPRWSRHPRLLV